jgi:hypothetical protein
MKKTLILTAICAICALAITFVACKKETEEGTKKAPKSGNLADVGIYDDFEFGEGYLLDEQAVKSHNKVIVRTVFNNGDVWIEKRGEGGTDNSSIYDIYVMKDGKSYSSFCAAYVSNAFGGLTECYEFGTLNQVKKEQIISALNYIYNTYGSLNGWMEELPNPKDVNPDNSTKVVAQSVIWMILDYVDGFGALIQPQNGIVSINPEYSMPGYYDYGPYINRGFEEAIDAAFAARNSNIEGPVTDLAYLVGPNYPSDVVSWQPQIIPLGKVNSDPICVSFTKQVWAPTMPEGRVINDDEFSFQLWKMDGTAYVNTGKVSFTRLNGKVEFCGLYEGNYQIREILPAGSNWETAQPINFNVSANGTVTGGIKADGTTIVVNKPKMGPAYGSVTATDDKLNYLARVQATLNPKNGNAQFPISYNPGRVVYNANHFMYARLTRAELETGVELAMVVGNKFDYVGKAFAKIVDGNIVVTIENFGKGNFGVMAFNKEMTDKMPKNGNIHSQKEADLKKELNATTGFDHNNNLVVPCPGGNSIFLYIHCGTIQFYLPVN